MTARKIRIIAFVWPLLSTLFIAAADVPRPASGAEPSATADRPNILWITCEDISPHLGCYGDAYAATPTLDRLAAEGVRFTRAFATASVCTPARSGLITGMFASSLGTQHLRGPTQPPASIRCFSEYLREAGYHCTNNVKEDYNFTAKEAWDESSAKAHWRSRRPGQPFFAVFNFTTTHQGKIRESDEQFARRTARVTPQQRHDPALAPLPPYYPDTPIVRRDVARLYDLITAMDYQVADVLAQLEEDGLADDTIVFFYSDHGDGLPRHKRWLYESGTRVPLIVRIPPKHCAAGDEAPDSTDPRLVSFVDFAPTVLSLAGLDIPEQMPGRVFLGKHTAAPRQYVFAIRDRVDECYELSRMMHDGRYQYIRNYLPHRPRMQLSYYSEQTPLRKELRRLAAAGKLTGPARDFLAATKPAEELYDTQADPHQVRNLAESPEHRDVLDRLRAQLRRWMLDRRDTGLLPEPMLHARAKGQTCYEMAQNPQRYPIERILDAAELVGRGQGRLDEITIRLDDDDPAVRFWSAMAAAALGKEAAPARKRLAALLEDPAPSVRLAAAEACCGIGQEGAAVPVIVELLEDDDPRVQLMAAMTLVAVGPAAEPAKEDIRKIVAKPTTAGNFGLYTRWALSHAPGR